ncbi:MAG: response regulator transcription factor [Spirochaetes bacterium]|nr:response regulator transcription factor [Spirochaetota bacterium]
MKLLIADDSKAVRERLYEMLSDIPGVKEIIQAKSGSEAVALTREHDPDVVILDIRMPGREEHNKGNGISSLEKIKKFKNTTVVIMLTNYPLPQYRKECMNRGADHFFDKSIEFEKVIAVIENLIAGKLAGRRGDKVNNPEETEHE